MATFALLHGGSHGGWCWERVIPLLEAHGHRAIAPDLPMHDNGCDSLDWANCVVGALPSGDDDLVVVGHSFGGLAVPVVASLRKVERLVFLGAMVPVPGLAYYEYLQRPEAAGAITMPMDRLEQDSEGRTVVPPEVAREIFYADCAEDDIERAVARLTPCSGAAFGRRCPINEWPDVPSTYVLMTDDRAVGQDWSRRVSLERFGTNAIELPGSHSPFYSRPEQLAGVLLSLV